MRYATLAERKEFYTKEFKIGSLANWFGDKMDRTKFALIMGNTPTFSWINTKRHFNYHNNRSI